MRLVTAQCHPIRYIQDITFTTRKLFAYKDYCHIGRYKYNTIDSIRTYHKPGIRGVNLTSLINAVDMSQMAQCMANTNTQQ